MGPFQDNTRLGKTYRSLLEIEMDKLNIQLTERSRSGKLNQPTLPSVFDLGDKVVKSLSPEGQQRINDIGLINKNLTQSQISELQSKVDAQLAKKGPYSNSQAKAGKLISDAANKIRQELAAKKGKKDDDDHGGGHNQDNKGDSTNKQTPPDNNNNPSAIVLNGKKETILPKELQILNQLKATPLYTKTMAETAKHFGPNSWAFKGLDTIGQKNTAEKIYVSQIAKSLFAVGFSINQVDVALLAVGIGRVDIRAKIMTAVGANLLNNTVKIDGQTIPSGIGVAKGAISPSGNNGIRVPARLRVGR